MAISFIVFACCLVVMSLGQNDVSSPPSEGASRNDPNAICRRQFNFTQNVEGQQVQDQCRVRCRENNTRLIMGEVAMEDGAICGDNRECIGNNCHFTDDVQICRQALGGNLTRMESGFQCHLRCINDNNQTTANSSGRNTCTRMTIYAWMSREEGICRDGDCIQKQK